MKDKAKSVHMANKSPHEVATTEEVRQAVEKIIKKYHKAFKNLAGR